MPRELRHEYARYFRNNGFGLDSWRRFSPGLIRASAEFAYLYWARKIEPFVKHRDVLDVGCGMGLHSLGFVVSGVRSYTGCDPKVQLDSDQMKHKVTLKTVSSGWTPRQIMMRLPQVRYVRGTIADLPPESQSDVAVLHNVTEHLLDLEGMFVSLRRRLRPRGLLIFLHHNFYAWNGHHRAPRRVSAFDPSNAEQRKHIDWAHIGAEPEPGSYAATRLNRIRLDDLRALTDKYYTVEKWEESLSKESHGGLRLTEDILRRHPTFTRRELETQNVLCVARKREE